MFAATVGGQRRSRYLRIYIALIATAVTIGTMSAPALADTPEPGSNGGGDIVDSRDVAAALADVPGLLSDSDQIRTSSDSDSALITAKDGVKLDVPADISDGVGLTAPGLPGGSPLTMTVTPPAAPSDAVPIAPGVVAYPSTDGTATAVQASENGGGRIITVISGPDSPTSYPYDVDLQAGFSLSLDPDTGGANVLDDQGRAVTTFAPPWAKDANGAAVPTHYEISGTKLIQIVDHTSGTYTYPLTADPWFGIRLIDRVAWDQNTLRVYPTSASRNPFMISVAARWAAWAEVTKLAPSANRNNMADQFYCHWDLVRLRAPNKVSWNLDKNRPDVGYFATVRAQCNP